MKYEVQCTHCENKQIYQPKKKLTKDSHTKCSHCHKDFYVKVDMSEEIINAKVTTVPKGKGKQPLKLSSKITEITPEVIEGLLVDALNKYPDVTTLKLVVEFYTKIKINQGEKLDILDMDKFLEVSNTLAYDPSSS